MKTHLSHSGLGNRARSGIRGLLFFALSFCALSTNANAVINVDLGTADSFAVLAGSAVTNTGATHINGNLGVWPGTSITGFPPGIVSGTTHSADAAAQQAQLDLATAYDVAAAESCGNVLTGQDLGGLTLTPGVYCFDSSAQLTGTLNLDAQGNLNEVFLFQIGSTLTTASTSSVVFSNTKGNVYWQVGSSATLGTGTGFIGNILALTSITLNTGANIQCGRALARNGAVSLDTNQVSFDRCENTPGGGNEVPEPGTATLLSMGLVSLMGHARKFRKHSK
jgi:hypothetical protein